MNTLDDFIAAFQESIQRKDFVKITLSKPPSKSADLQNVYIRLVRIKKDDKYSTTYRYKTNDQVKNYSLDELLTELTKLLTESFRNATLFSLDSDIALQRNKKGNISIKRHNATFSNIPDIAHDEQKERKSSSNAAYLHQLGVTDANGNVIPRMADKFKQINKYLEIVENLIKQAELPKKISIVDMGSGKGYLTFALYDFLTNRLKLDAHVVGIELRKELVDQCNGVAKTLEFENLKFISKPIEEFKPKKAIDILIALHACDTATDDAIYKGLLSNSKIIICAPCCHKQVRQSVKGVEQSNPMLKYGIFKEREFEMITDTIRAMIMEEHGYKSNIFEFISNEHTRKNIMLTGIKQSQKGSDDSIKNKISALKTNNKIQKHYLEELLESTN